MVKTISKKIKFVDTNILLSHLDQIEKEDFFMLSSITLTELEDIKTNRNKSDDIKYAARKAVRFLGENSNKYKIVVYDVLSKYDFMEYGLEDSPDNRIIRCAEYAKNILNYDIVFVSNDILARLIAKDYFHLEVSGLSDSDVDFYKGYIAVTLSDEETAYMYEHMNENQFDMLINQYVLIKNKNHDLIDVLKWTETGLETVRQKSFKSNMFGTLKPLDAIQRCAIDSIINNDITVLYGRAGSGKTTLPLNYIMQMLEKGTYKKCYIIYSYEPLKGAKTLGYEKGDHITKLLYSASLGNILSSKFGDIQMVERMIDLGQIEIIPTANIRGVEISEDSILLLTESQNLDVYTLKTIIQRCKDGCKQIYEGDIIEQKDTNISQLGINRLIEVFKGHSKFGCVKLKNNYRGELTELADKM